MNHTGVTPNANPPSSVGGADWSPGDPDGVEITGDVVEPRAFSAVMPSPWSGWPGDWSTPAWGGIGDKLTGLVDTAWACLDLNASVMSAMPAFRTRSERILPATTWMLNPDETIYTSWNEFAKQLFWDYQLGEAFVLPTSFGSDNWPASFRVIPPWLVNVEMDTGRRSYRIGTLDVTDDILHIRYRSTTESAHGIGPLEAAGARMIAAAVLARYMSELVQGGGVPYLTLETDVPLTKEQANDLRDQWWQARIENLGKPAVLHTGVKAVAHQMTPRDMAMLELSQFNESRIAILLGVPPFLVGLPSGGDPMTYSNISLLFDFHYRASLRPKVASVMSALSGWVLPRGQRVELNHDEYTRPALKERVEAYEKLVAMDALSAEEIRRMERLVGEMSGRAELPNQDAIDALTGRVQS